MDFLLDQILFFTSEKHQEIYIHLNSKFDIKYQDLFSICASIGFKNNRKTPIENRGREFRSNYLNSNQRATAYSIILADPEIGKSIEQFDDSEFRRKAKRRLEEYAEGGIEILIEEVFGNCWDGNKLDQNYTEYEIDILGYIYFDTKEVPF
ncbi:hypothetical protein [Virgibacillus ndiopensis]|uniref:hypothetical protein n=1 Tax=Virgibacillus ndiopensis TaxID=2004408 RepID=UPI000C08CC7A|nr:hypothetical protein [Virgibacillus ndiopensis]